MLGNLNWRPLDQRRIDNRLVMVYTVTYHLVSIPAYAYLIPNRRESKFIHPLAYKQIPTSTNYNKYSFFPQTIEHGNAAQPALSCFLLWHSLVVLCVRWCMYPPNHQILFYLLTILTLFSHCTNSSHTLALSFISANPL